MRKRKIGGPIPSMLSADSAALAIFGEMSVSLIRIAEELANLSGFPTIVRPLEEDPSFFRWGINSKHLSVFNFVVEIMDLALQDMLLITV